MPEGTIQFAYELAPPEDGLIEPATFAELAAWRSILRMLGLFGQTADRYDGYCFGNLSARDATLSEELIITGSQTGANEELHTEQLVRITHANLSRFWVEAVGVAPPSSETLTHAMVYAVDPRVRFVFYVRSAELWHAASALAIPATPEDVACGTPAMAEAVRAVLETHHSRPLAFATRGHEDGIIVCGPEARDVGGLLVSYLARALAAKAA